MTKTVKIFRGFKSIDRGKKPKDTTNPHRMIFVYNFFQNDCLK